MSRSHKPIRIGIVGCGAIGSHVARGVHNGLTNVCAISGLFDVNTTKALSLARSLHAPRIVRRSLDDLIAHSDIVVEAVASKNTSQIIEMILHARKDVLVMSVGCLLGADNLFKLAQKNGCSILVPSGAIAGIDAIKAARQAGIKKITLTTRKPPAGLMGNPYLIKKGIDVTTIKKETVVFKGNVLKAIAAFPQNINVAATIALAAQSPKVVTVQILTSPAYTCNSHEIEVKGTFGRMVTRTENVPFRENPKTSYLAALSGLQSLKQFCTKIFIGT